MTGLRLEYSDINPQNWGMVDSDQPLPLQQHWAYAKATQALGARPFQLNLFDENSAQVGLAVYMHRKFFGLIRFNTLFRGPLWFAGRENADLRRGFYHAVRQEFPKHRWRFITLLPEFGAESPEASELAQLGWRRVMTGFSTAWLDLRPDVEALRSALTGKWRNQLKKAEGERLTLSVGGRKAHQYSWLLEREAEQRNNRRYQATPLGLVPAYCETHDKSGPPVLSVTALAGRDKVAGALFLLHGHSATYHIGWVSQAGRQMNAQNRVLWEAIIALRSRGIRFLDLGGLNTAELAGITRFKLGMGAKPHTLAGSYM